MLAAGSAVFGTAACGPFAKTTPKTGTAANTRSYHSRPDLSVPIVTTTDGLAGAAAGLIFVAPGGPMILDGAGTPIWFHPVPGKNVANFRPQFYQGKPVLTWWEGKVGKGYALSGELVIADASYNAVRRIAAGNGYQADLHEFQLTSRNSVLLTAYHEVPADLTVVGGPAAGSALDGIMQEIDLASGKVVFEWHSLEQVPLSESHAGYVKGQPYDYFHINSIEVDEDDNLLVSARNTWAVYKIDRSSGNVLWRMGGRKSDFAMGPNTTFAWQHDARRQADGTITLFDDGAAPKVEAKSRALVLNVDEAAKTVSLKMAYTHANTLATSQGNMQVLSNGNVFVGWGSEPYFTEFNKAGRVVLDGKFAGTFQSYRAFRLPWSGTPAEKPAIAALREGDAITIYASWNGATEASRWQVIGGPDTSSFEPLGSAKRTGFETPIKIAAAPAYVAVQALDASGAVLATSAMTSL